ncbi:MAG: HD-like signal output (HDOD) protein [Oceanospirillaceae bacterium]|jgi:HD-like signal output (HDOD) protein
MNTPRILFLDDEINILKSLQRGLRLHCRGWHLEFCTSAADALLLLPEFDPWVVVSDKRMPGMDGADFLRIVSKEKPEAVRILLTGDTSPEVAFEVVDVAHMLIAKPFEIETLVLLLSRAKCLRSLPLTPLIRGQLGSINCIPVLPKVYQQLTDYLKNDEIETSEIARIIALEPSVLAKLMQLANSAFFGFSHPITSPNEAIVRFGTELIKDFVLCFGLFKQCDTADEEMRNRLFSDAMDIALIARQLGLACGLKKSALDEIFILGLLHNIGMLMSSMLGIKLQVVEGSVESNADNIVGAYLLALWEFNSDFVNATLYQDNPEAAEKVTPLCCLLSVAKIVSRARKEGISSLDEQSGLNKSLLESQGLLDNVIVCINEIEN